MKTTENSEMKMDPGRKIKLKRKRKEIKSHTLKGEDVRAMELKKETSQNRTKPHSNLSSVWFHLVLSCDTFFYVSY